MTEKGRDCYWYPRRGSGQSMHVHSRGLGILVGLRPINTALVVSTAIPAAMGGGFAHVSVCATRLCMEQSGRRQKEDDGADQSGENRFLFSVIFQKMPRGFYMLVFSMG